MAYPRAWIAQDWAMPEWDGRGDPPEPFDGTGALPSLDPATAHIDTGQAAIDQRDDWPSTEEAIEWARERVSVVLVRVGYSDYYSAGEEHPPGVPLWPPTEDAIRNETRRSG